MTSAADPTGVSSTASTTVVTSADLELVKRGPATAQPGATVVYTLTLRNLGPSTAAGVVLTDTLPAGLTFAAASAGCVNTSGTVVCTVGSLAADTTVVCTVTATVDAGVQPGASLENAATVSDKLDRPQPAQQRGHRRHERRRRGGLDDQQERQPGQRDAGRDRDLHDPHHQHRPRPGAQRGRERPAPGRLDLSLSLGLGRRGVRRARCASSARWRSGATRTITVVAQVNPDAPAGTVTNTAAVYSTDESNQANNTATANTDHHDLRGRGGAQGGLERPGGADRGPAVRVAGQQRRAVGRAERGGDGYPGRQRDFRQRQRGLRAH